MKGKHKAKRKRRDARKAKNVRELERTKEAKAAEEGVEKKEIVLFIVAVFLATCIALLLIFWVITSDFPEACMILLKAIGFTTVFLIAICFTTVVIFFGLRKLFKRK